MCRQAAAASKILRVERQNIVEKIIEKYPVRKALGSRGNIQDLLRVERPNIVDKNYTKYNQRKALGSRGRIQE